MSNFMVMRPAVAELFHSGGWTDKKKLIVNCSNFAKAPKNKTCSQYIYKVSVAVSLNITFL